MAGRSAWRPGALENVAPPCDHIGHYTSRGVGELGDHMGHFTAVELTLTTKSSDIIGT